MTNAVIEQSLAELSGVGTPSAVIEQSLAELSGVGTPSAVIEQSLAELSGVGTPSAVIVQALLEISVSLVSNPLIPTIIFPDLTLASNGAGWSVHRRPTTSTRVAAAVSGREVRTPYYVVPLYEIELTYDALNSDSVPFDALGAETLQALQGFFLQCQGQYASFLFVDPDFCQMAGSLCGTGDGITTAFPLMRWVGAYSEQIQAANIVSAAYVNGVPQGSGTWNVANGNQLVFASPPAVGAAITADFTYYFVCRFEDDMHDYEEFMKNLHSLSSCKFRSVRTS